MLNYTHSMLQQLHSLQAYITHHGDAKFEFKLFHYFTKALLQKMGIMSDFEKHKTITFLKTCKNIP